MRRSILPPLGLRRRNRPARGRQLGVGPLVHGGAEALVHLDQLQPGPGALAPVERGFEILILGIRRTEADMLTPLTKAQKFDVAASRQMWACRPST
jgi:hypothetical protein